MRKNICDCEKDCLPCLCSNSTTINERHKMRQFRAYYESEEDLTGYTIIRIKADTIEKAHAKAIEKRIELSHAYGVIFDLLDVEPIENQ